MSANAVHSAKVIAFLKRGIRSGKFRPGSPIREVNIAKQLGVSRGPVREALRTLQESGLLVGEPQKTKYVSSFSKKELKERFSYIALLENACILQGLETMTEADFERLEKLCGKMSAKQGGGDAVLKVCQSFHEDILGHCPNAFMAETLRKFRVNMLDLLTAYKSEEYWNVDAGELHRTLVGALRTRDPETITRAVADHYAGMVEKILKKMEE
ncbi:MAG: GntR family transcriptional regulator [Desulfovibrio sp.]|nr:GntR family transcriptional regulator [Desulfovibrio sp.]